MAAEFNKRDIKFEYEPDVLTYTLTLAYTPDWKLNAFYIESKGKFDYEDRRKMLNVIKQNPHKDIRLCFMRNNRISKRSKMTYGDWCDNYGIKWSVFPVLPL